MSSIDRSVLDSPIRFFSIGENLAEKREEGTSRVDLKLGCAQMQEMMMAATAKGSPIPHLPPPDQMVSTGDEEKGLRPADQILQDAQHPIQKLQELENNANKAGGNSALDIENGISQPTSPDENGTSSTSTATTGRERKLDFDLKSSLFLITVSMIPLTDILFLHGPTAKLKPILKFTAFAAFTSFISAICLMFHTFKLKVMAIKPEQLITKCQLRVSMTLFAISVGSLFLTCISITYSLLPKAWYFLPIALLPPLLVGGFHLLYAFKTGNGEINPAKIKALKKELKRAMQLTLSLVSTSFSGFTGVLLAIYHKADSLSAAYSYTKVSVYLLLGGGIAGAFALLLCRLLHSSNPVRTAWQRAILAAADVVMIAMIVPAVLMIAETILHGLLAGAVLFPVVAGVAAWLLFEFCTAADAGCTETKEDGKAAHGTMYAVAVAVASVSFGAIVAIFAGMLGGAVGKKQLKACTFFLASAFVAAVSLGVVVTMPGVAWAEKTKASTGFAAAVLTCCSLGTLVLAALALFYQIAA